MGKNLQRVGFLKDHSVFFVLLYQKIKITNPMLCNAAVSSEEWSICDIECWSSRCFTSLIFMPISIGSSFTLGVPSQDILGSETETDVIVPCWYRAVWWCLLTCSCSLRSDFNFELEDLLLVDLNLTKW